MDEKRLKEIGDLWDVQHRRKPWGRIVSDLIREVRKGKDERDNLRSKLRKYEWLSDNEHNIELDYCLDCAGYRPDHNSDCELAELLKEVKR